MKHHWWIPVIRAFFTSPTGPSQSYGHDFYSHPIDPERWVSVVPGSYIWGLHLQSSSRSVFHYHGAGDNPWCWNMNPNIYPQKWPSYVAQNIPKYSSTMGCICYLGTLFPIPLRIWRNWPFFHSKCCNCVVIRKSVPPDFLQTMDDWKNKYTVDDSRWLSYIILYDRRCLWWL